MKSAKIELDVDFIGGERSLTEEDQQAISAYLRQRRVSTIKNSSTKKTKATKRVKAIA